MGSIVQNVAGAVVGGIFTDRAASRAARGQREANALNREMWEESRDLSMPFISGGQDAFSALMSSYGLGGESPNYDQFFQSPDYQFALQQGELALQRRQSAQGNRLSPGAYKELLSLNQGMSTQHLGNYRSGLQGIAGTGINALGMLSGAREGYTARGAQGLQNLGDIGAARYLGYGNVFGNLFGGQSANASTYGSGGYQSPFGTGGNVGSGGGNFGIGAADYLGPLFGGG